MTDPSKVPEMQVDSFWLEAKTGEIIHVLHENCRFDPTNTILPHLSGEIWETKKERRSDSSFLHLALSGSLLLLGLLLSQGLRQEFLELLVLELLLGLDKLRLVPRWRVSK